jgi:uncharacterized protein (TIGR03000 family)
MYTVILMAALAPGHATTGQYGAAPTCACRGCWGCYGGYSGSGYNYMAASGYLSAFSTYAPVAGAVATGCRGCYGCYGGWSCYGAPLPGHGTWSAAPPAAAPAAPKAEETPAPKEQLPAPKEKKKDESTRAQLTLDVPEGAKVYLDGELMNLSPGKRLFQTPPLVSGRVYFYDLRVEVTRDGKTVTENQRVLLRPGQTVVAAFPGLARDGVVPVANR